MFLSRLVLNPRSRQVRREIAEPYEMHRTVMRAFPAAIQDREERVLFRLDTSREAGALVVLVQSQGAPDWSCLEANPGYLVAPPESKEFHPAFRVGQRLFFRLRANPTVKRKGKRLGLLTEESQMGWLDRKAGAGGFRVVSAQVIRESMVHGRKTENGDRHTLAHLSVRFDGVLEVREPERLVQALRAGIGSGKGFGFGLLSLKRTE